MAFVKKFICLASSRKYGGFCLAGKEWADGKTGAWIRPVTSRPMGEFEPHEMSLPDGSLPRLFDVIQVSLVKPMPRAYQTENYLMNRWPRHLKVGTFPVTEQDKLLDTPQALWINGYQSRNGRHDRVPQHRAETGLTSSLLFVKPEGLTIIVAEEASRRRVRAEFRYGGEVYRLMVTDFLIENKYRARGLGMYPVEGDQSFICVSLGEPYNGFCYKLAAAITNIV